MQSNTAVPFTAPEGLAVTLSTPHRGPVRGLGVKAGVTVIVGGGFHGKSTLLDAIQVGCYNKVPGGRGAGGRGACLRAGFQSWCISLSLRFVCDFTRSR